MMSTKTVEEEVLTLLPMCEANRQLVTHPNVYAGNIVFNVGALKLIDKAP